MDDVDSMSRGRAMAYRCPSCDRSFVAVGEAKAAVLCPCGATLASKPLGRGLYELKSPVAEDAGRADPGQRTMPAEVDVGYGASHGNDPSHGGPSGPGDAPAEVPER